MPSRYLPARIKTCLIINQLQNLVPPKAVQTNPFVFQSLPTNTLSLDSTQRIRVSFNPFHMHVASSRMNICDRFFFLLETVRLWAGSCRWMGFVEKMSGCSSCRSVQGAVLMGPADLRRRSLWDPLFCFLFSPSVTPSCRSTPQIASASAQAQRGMQQGSFLHAH